VWLYLRLKLSYRDVEDLLAERGLDIFYETIRSWVLKFGPVIAQRLRRGPPRPSDRWQLDEMVVRIAGERLYLRRAVDHEGEVLGMRFSAGTTGGRAHELLLSLRLASDGSGLLRYSGGGRSRGIWTISAAKFGFLHDR
jgi:transposase-like protein